MAREGPSGNPGMFLIERSLIHGPRDWRIFRRLPADSAGNAPASAERVPFAFGTPLEWAFEALHLRSLSWQLAPTFESDLWAHPMQNYSRPQVLYPGLKFDTSHLEARLWRLGYTEPAGAAFNPGQFRAKAAGIEVSTRSIAQPNAWIDFIRSIGKSASVDGRPDPPGVVRTWIDPRNGALATEDCPETLEELFALGTEPLDRFPAIADLGGWVSLDREHPLKRAG